MRGTEAVYRNASQNTSLNETLNDDRGEATALLTTGPLSIRRDGSLLEVHVEPFDKLVDVLEDIRPAVCGACFDYQFRLDAYLLELGDECFGLLQC